MAEPRVVLDSSAVIALLVAEPPGKAIAVLIDSGDARMSIVNAAEVVDVLVRVHGGEPDRVILGIEDLLSTVVEPVPASLGLATKAGELRARLYRRRSSRLSLADCFVLATAEPGDLIATTDRTLAATARAEGYQVVTPA